ncbi:MAG: hypothetical protein HYX53_11360 [Chloroflexi bacterium]|nr:hypothetical protein [Chloroflexota bacterium]
MIRVVAAAVVTAWVSMATACGGSSGAAPAAARTAGSATPAATRTPNLGSAPPRLGGNIMKVTPAHGSRVTQASTRTTDPNKPSGLCIDVSFAGIGGENALMWFRLVLDASEVTVAPGITWGGFDNPDAPTRGRLCYAPPGGLQPGLHTAAAAVRDPNDISNAPAMQIVSWVFEVLP